jgi:hypothetical protein
VLRTVFLLPFLMSRIFEQASCPLSFEFEMKAVMRQQVLWLLMLLIAPTVGKANDISFGPSGVGSSSAAVILMGETANQQVSLMLSGNDFYTDSNLRIVINGGVEPAPRITAVYNDPALAIPGANLAGSIWENGSGGIFGAPNGTAADSSGLTTVAFYVAAGATPKNQSGLHTLLTFSTIGVPPGVYTFDITTSDLFNGLDDEFNPIPVPLTFTATTLYVGLPEPSSIVLALFAAGGVAVVAIRRRRSAQTSLSA